MEERTYLKWYNKVGYGSGDIAGNVVYAFLSAFVMIFLTDTIGLNAGIVGSLIAASKLFDGISDVFFGSLIDKTHSKMGKARPWMFYGYFGCALCLAAIFFIPAGAGEFAQYAWFFIAYTLLNAGFYTANNIAYSALTALVTKNNHERVQMGSIRFMFAFGTSMLIQTITVGCVAYFGGGWLLAYSGYVGGAETQTASCINMLHIMYLWLPMIFNLLITVILTKMDVEKAVQKLRGTGR